MSLSVGVAEVAQAFGNQALNPGTQFPIYPFPDAVNAPPSPGGLEDFIRSPSVWDSVVIAGAISPGLASVDARRRWKVDEKPKPGGDVTVLTNIGSEPVYATIRIGVWVASEWNSLVTWVQTVFPKLGKGFPKPLSVHHPQLALLNCHDLYFTEVRSEFDKERKYLTLILEATEWLPQNQATMLNTPVAAQDNGEDFNGLLSTPIQQVNSSSTATQAQANPPNTDPGVAGPPT